MPVCIMWQAKLKKIELWLYAKIIGISIIVFFQYIYQVVILLFNVFDGLHGGRLISWNFWPNLIKIWNGRYVINNSTKISAHEFCYYCIQSMYDIECNVSKAGFGNCWCLVSNSWPSPNHWTGGFESNFFTFTYILVYSGLFCPKLVREDVWHTQLKNTS